MGRYGSVKSAVEHAVTKNVEIGETFQVRDAADWLADRLTYQQVQGALHNSTKRRAYVPWKRVGYGLYERTEWQTARDERSPDEYHGPNPGGGGPLILYRTEIDGIYVDHDSGYVGDGTYRHYRVIEVDPPDRPIHRHLTAHPDDPDYVHRHANGHHSHKHAGDAYDGVVR